MEYLNSISHTNLDDNQLYQIMFLAEHNNDAFICHIRGNLCKDLDGFFQEVSSGMRFPFYFGWNWDAFDECVSDLEWLKFSSLVIVIDHYCDVFCSDNNISKNKVLLEKHLKLALEYWVEQCIPITILLNN